MNSLLDPFENVALITLDSDEMIRSQHLDRESGAALLAKEGIGGDDDRLGKGK